MFLLLLLEHTLQLSDGQGAVGRKVETQQVAMRMLTDAHCGKPTHRDTSDGQADLGAPYVGGNVCKPFSRPASL